MAAAYAGIVTIGYLVLGMSWSLALGVLIVVCAVARLLPRVPVALPPVRIPDWQPCALFLGCAAVLIYLLMLGRTSEPLISPWNVLGMESWLLYVGLIGSYLWCARRTSGAVTGVLSVLLMFISVGVSVALYGVGFGFDPFVHRAAEAALFAHGSIEPVQLLYSGQYATVTALAHVTHIPVRLIDIVLLPLLASLLPIALMAGLREGWGVSERTSRVVWLVALLVPYMLLTFTIPFTVTYLWWMVLLFLLPAITSWQREAMTLGVAAVAVLFHPLLAVPAGVALIGWMLYRRKPVWWVGLLALAGMALAVPLLMVAYQWQQGQVVSLTSLLQHANAFGALFRNPFIDRFPYIPVHLDVLYWWRYWAPVGFMGGALIWIAWQRCSLPSYMRYYTVLIAGLFCSLYPLCP